MQTSHLTRSSISGARHARANDRSGLAYRRSKVGDIIELWATDPGVKADVRAWAAKTKNEVMSVDEQGDKIVSVLRIKRR